MRQSMSRAPRREQIERMMCIFRDERLDSAPSLLALVTDGPGLSIDEPRRDSKVHPPAVRVPHSS